jgi:cytochrome c biogenesis protein CcdA
MTILFVSFLAGVLTILAPCAISMIPILLARTSDGVRRHSPVLVIFGLGFSIILFSILLKSSTLLINVPDAVWGVVSGAIVAIFGLVTLFPSIWDRLVMWSGLSLKAQKGVGEASQKRGAAGDVLLGASLGPVFSACSPTYALIVASILPAEPLTGLTYLLAFVAGLSLMLGLLAIFGQALVKKLGWGLNPNGAFKKILGAVLLVVGLAIAFGLDKTLLTFLVEAGLFDWQIQLESGLMN